MKFLYKFFVTGLDFLIRRLGGTVQHLVIFIKILEIDGLDIFKLGITDFKNFFMLFKAVSSAG